MTLETNNILIPTLLTVIGFLIMRYINRNDKKLDIFITLVTDLSKQLAVVISNYDFKDKNCTATHKLIDHKFEKLEEKELTTKNNPKN